jgi:PGF-CTERM protein
VSATLPEVPTITPTPTEEETLETPPMAAEEESGFEIAFAIAGLLAVAYLLRRRKR